MSPIYRLVGYRRISVCFRILLLLAVWTGPIPYCHCHGTMIGVDANCPSWLLNHLQAFHADSPLRTDVSLGWHLHFSTPENSEDGESTWAKWLSFSGTPSAVSACLQDLRLADRLILPLWNVTCRNSQPIASRVAFFFESFAPSLPLPLRLGVIRC